MRLHRFYVGNEFDLTHDFWLHDERLLHQWSNVLRFREGQEVVLFNDTDERLYRVAELTRDEAHLLHVTDFKRKTPEKNIYLLWSLLKKDKNDWVLQKGTELGVSHFLPLLADRSEKTGFNVERARKIVIESSEQCGRSDIPTIREPETIEAVLKSFDGKVPLLICEQTGKDTWTDLKNIGVLIGPEGGWSDQEMQLFEKFKLPSLNIHNFTLRAETAAIAAVTKLA